MGQLWRTWNCPKVSKLQDCHEEFFQMLKFRDPSSCKKIEKPFLERYFTEIQLGAAIISVWDRSITALRGYQKNEEETKQKIESLGRQWTKVRIDHASFNSVGLLLLEFVCLKHGAKWHARDQKAWIWALQIIQNALYIGASSRLI